MLALTNRKIIITACTIIALSLACSFYFLQSNSFSRWDHTVFDGFFQIRGPLDAGRDVVIVALDRESSRRLQRKTTGWRRSDFAQIIQILSADGADLIAIDYLFAIPDLAPEEDEALRSAIAQSANVILASDISTRNRAVPFAPFREQEVAEGFVNLLPDEDGVMRQIPPPHATTTDQDQLQLDFPFSVQIALARLYPQGDFKVDLGRPGTIILGDLEIPLAGAKPTDGFLVNYAGPSGHFPVIPVYKILHRQFNANEVAGKVVLVGSMNPYLHDYYTVPFRNTEHKEALVEEETMQSMYGVEIHANAVETLLARRFLAPIPGRTAVQILAVVALFAVLLAVAVRWNAFLIIGGALLLLAAIWLGSYSLFLSGTVIPVSPLLFCVASVTLTGIVARHAEEAAERRYVTQLFGRYVAPSVVQELLRNRDLVQFSGRKQRLTIFFSDIRGFTSMSEKMKPEEVSTLLNEYFSRMTLIVFKHKGTLDKFMGDAIMAFFGNPVFFLNHAEEAVNMALEMREEMQKLKMEWSRQGREASFDIGMGINTGEVVVGNLGSKEFFDYTVIGDEVNLACRLESIAKRGQIIISTSTYEEVKGKFETRRLDPVTVKGKSQPIEIYEVTARIP